ncbi:RNB-domain-containing protein [Dothidotthia symphoricarpi CBS 119687]|uniref:RNB-domain-containing protein n=1 Tax=Dothidotthia symphoricarpi CBS 119687 TaxID=1392245 RepID=A0A6A5ZXL2_9PLEO|nr:RNB-domain-containing protein [Dothidotthia symphoricarpi CBS 119687]KAF2124502.1 RNB-domain-containing protein [Dothidotthia symphoricarpi CBS 119687]
MHPRSLWTAGDVCWRCQWRLSNQYQKLGRTRRLELSSAKVLRLPRRTFHASATHSQLANDSAPASQPFDPALIPRTPELSIRVHLELWDEKFGGPGEEVLSAFENHPAHGDIQNGLTKLTTGAKADEEAEAEEWDEDDQGEELITIGLFLKPGDVVELSQPGREPVLAVFVQQLANVSQFFSANGRWSHSMLSRVSFAIPGCVDPAILQPLIPFLPTSPGIADPKGEVHVPTEAALPVQRILERLTEESEKIYRTNAPVLDSAYADLADATRTRMMTLTQITKKLLAGKHAAYQPSPAALLAVRKALNHNEFRFKSDERSHRLTNVFAIRPKNDVEIVETVLEWIREYREHQAMAATQTLKPSYKQSKGTIYVVQFLEKVRRTIAQSRKNRDPNTGFVGPSKIRLSRTEPSSAPQVFMGERFSSTDKQIINFIHAWSLPKQFAHMAAFHSACAGLIMATGCYGPKVLHNTEGLDQTSKACKRTTGVLFLQEIGVISPYENCSLYDEQLMLPTIRVSRNVELLNAKAEVTRQNPDFRDSMADLRRDWGSTTVYCIDPIGAQEIDDGVSIEKIDGSDSELWLHVHVANPTAFFDKTHTLSGLAAHMTETVYLPERTFPMLPTWVTHAHFSIARNRPVITFSTRVNRTGEVLETKIQHGTVHNVVSKTPSEVARLLGDVSTTETRRLVVGGDVPRVERDDTPTKVSPAQLQELQDLYSIARILRKTRDARGALHLCGSTPDLRVFENSNQPGLTWNSPSLERTRTIQGDPIIELTQRIPKGYVTTEFNATNIVEEMMLLACQTAASWCTERNIPVMYRGTVEMPTAEELSPEDLKQQLVLPYLEKHGDLTRSLATRYIRSLGRAIAHSAPLPHKMIGASSYVKVTSPLRRFSDMIAHWQIEAALRHEAESGTQFGADPANPRANPLPFSQRQMQESIITLSPREKIIKSASNASNRFWAALAMMRAFHYKEAPLPDLFKCWVRSVPEGKGKTAVGFRETVGYLPEYGLSVVVVKGEEVRVGDEWEVRLRAVDMSLKAVFVTPVRLLNREVEGL